MPEEINYCVRCGRALERREAFGKVRPVCPGCGRVHFVDPKVAAGVVIEREGKLLLICRDNDPEKGKWSFPAGFVDGGEAPAHAAAREVEEETGLQVRITSLLDVVARDNQTEGADIVIVYRAEVTGGELAPGDDAAEVRYFGPDEIPELANFASVRRIVARWKRGG
jgi:ADP-ribose pyrophosphatase YjhB (NUDIX family)